MMGNSFEYPEDRLLRIQGIVPEELLSDLGTHKKNEKKNEHQGLTVLKDGGSTGLTIGHVTGMESFIRTEGGIQSIELAVYNVDRSKPFSKTGDSGSLVVDGSGRMVGLLHAGTRKKRSLQNEDSGVDVTYVTPMYWLQPRVKEWYRHADFDCYTW